ncbi:U3 small nucleolar RNA-associated protein 11 [Dissoconium aciculare CBS 342.82]|uniref:U3 small nucleolar RNA-associated protein 11 n=1 Tax=Dissoconium aciculare CBS 342.82 TaxID=1314786 RepID=A0A6J3M2T7_9PEZI|nr:U3 small nucleolar RNA-associated protein 11 [Dissoconium aciculare CBS 342.82]KAF1822213.1 U3 small nucleolar RNA-associated protein 11 [Dissoconium aciculare CBS 342.82]
MSSLRNAVQRRNHRERAQPAERAKWGLLEKRKDYKLRAADHKLKKRKINALKQKATERNEDEFYFGMLSSTTKGGIKRSQRGEDNSGGGGKSLSVDTVKLMKTQDQGYLQTMLQRTKNEIARLEQEVIMATHGVKLTKGATHGTFGEDGSLELTVPGASENIFDDEDLGSLDGDLEMEDGRSEASGKSDDEDFTPEQRATRDRKRHALDVKRKNLKALRDQEDKLASALDGVEHQRAKMNRTIGGVNKKGVQFKQRERKR